MAEEDAGTAKAERQRLLAARNAWMEALAGEYRRRRSKEAVDRIVQIQRAIEAVTAALEQAGDPAGAGKVGRGSDADGHGGG
jgi:hypothetical protein